MNEICTRFYSFVIKINTRPAGRVHGIDTRPGLETLVPVERSSVNVAHWNMSWILQEIFLETYEQRGQFDAIM